MDEVTQQNAALVEEAAAAAESLEDQAQTLTESVAVFRLDSSSGHSTGRAAPVIHAAAPVSRSPMAKKPIPKVSSGPAKRSAPPRSTANSSGGSSSKASIPANSGDDDEWAEF
jgi:hypothetical protein